MATVSVPDVPKLLIANVLPKTLKVANGDAIDLRWYDGDEVTAKTVTAIPPYGTVQRIPGSRIIDQNLEGGNADVPTATSDVRTYTAGTETYQVTERDVVAVTSLTGAAGGSPRTFVLNTDYELVSTGTYTTKDAIRWKSGGTKPDNGTSFTINYTHRFVDRQRFNRVRYTYRLVLFVTALKATEHGATVAYAKSRLAEQLLDALEAELMTKDGKNLFGTGELKLGACQAIGILPIDPADSYSRAVLDIEVYRKQVVTIEQTRLIGDVQKPTVSAS